MINLHNKFHRYVGFTKNKANGAKFEVLEKYGLSNLAGLEKIRIIKSGWLSNMSEILCQ